jgi:hypothetical protein
MLASRSETLARGGAGSHVRTTIPAELRRDVCWLARSHCLKKADVASAKHDVRACTAWRRNTAARHRERDVRGRKTPEVRRRLPATQAISCLRSSIIQVTGKCCTTWSAARRAPCRSRCARTQAIALVGSSRMSGSRFFRDCLRSADSCTLMTQDLVRHRELRGSR